MSKLAESLTELAVPSAEIAVACRLIGKSFTGRFVVRDVDLQVRRGTIHALVGENGAGKSTVLGMIGGRLRADTGSIAVFGEPIIEASPHESRRRGLVTVYQELTMVPHFNAVDNVFLGQLHHAAGVVRDREMRARFAELCREFNISIPWDVPAARLSVSQQQVVEILRGVQSGARVLLLDEPTAALAEREREGLHRLLKNLRERGTTIVIVSHNLEEVLDLSDDITVMRDGLVVRSAPRAEWDRPELVRAMVGRDVIIERRTRRHEVGEPMLRVSEVTNLGALQGINLEVRRGEIVGLWGLVGSGRTTFFRSLCGLEPYASGRFSLGGVEGPLPRSMRAAIDRGIVLVPESRKHALILGMTAVQNYWIGRKNTHGGRISGRSEQREAGQVTAKFGFDPARLTEAVRTLSGGNQQKVLLAKWAGHRPDVFLVDEPTRGIDIGAKAEVLRSLVQIAEAGSSVIVTSSELEEVLAICDRLVVFAHGRVTGEIDCRATEPDPHDILQLGFVESDVS